MENLLKLNRPIASKNRRSPIKLKGRHLVFIILSLFFLMLPMSCGESGDINLSKTNHKIRPKVDELRISREPRWPYGNMENSIRVMRHLGWAGTTWAGVHFGDDSRCIDYLLSRPEVDPERIGCTGLSGGGWRTDILAALDARIKAAVSVGWMTTGDYQQVYNVQGACGVSTMLPGVWDHIDIPDLIAMSAPCASMVVVGTKDHLFPPEGVQQANRQIQAAYDWAGYPKNFKAFNPDKVHCYDNDIQREAIAWLDYHLK